MKRLLIFVLVTALGLMAGCTTQSPAAPSEAPAANASSESPAESPNSEAPSETAEPTGEESYKIGITVMNIANPFFMTVVEAARAYGESRGVELMVNDGQFSPERQVEAIENFTAAGCNAIIVAALDGTAVLPAVQRAREQGIAVVAQTTEIAEYDAWLSLDEFNVGYALGEAAANYVVENFGTETPVKAAYMSWDAIPELVIRREGTQAAIKELAPNVEFVADAAAAEPSGGMDNAEAFLQAHPDLKIVLGAGDGAVLGAYQAFQAVGNDGSEYVLGGVDGSPEAIAAIKEGGIYRFSVETAPVWQGEKLVELALAAIKGETYEKHTIAPVSVVSIDNVADYE